MKKWLLYDNNAHRRSPDVIVDINNTAYKVEDSAGEEEDEDMESFQANELVGVREHD